MADLLSREKEFRKLNEQLDQLANSALEQNQQLTSQQQSQQDQTYQQQMQVPTPQQQLPPVQQQQIQQKQQHSQQRQSRQQQSQPPQQLPKRPQYHQQHPQQQNPHQPLQQQPHQGPPNSSQQLKNLQPKNHQPPTIDRPTRPKTETKYFTYTKNNNYTATMKKRGAGDAASEHTYSNTLPQPPPLQTPRPNPTDHSTNSLICSNEKQGMNRYKMTTASPATAATIANSGRMSQRDPSNVQATAPQQNLPINSAAAPATSPIPNNLKTSGQKSPQPISNRNIKLPYSARTCSRMSSRSSNVSNTGGPFTVRYRNPKFVESPSLEVLLKDEAALVRQQQSSGMIFSHDGVDVDSLVSATGSKTGEIDGKLSRKSQGCARKHISTEVLIKFLKSKIVILEEDHDHIAKEMLQQKELLEKTLERHKKLEQQRDQAFAKQNSLSEQLAKTELKLEEANRCIKERSTEQTNQQKEIEIVRREVKVFTQTNTNLEKRLLRANEELESAKNALAAMRETERELRETIRTESESKDKQIKSLRKQRADLLNAYKKQLFLIDNLKRQTQCLEQAKMIDFNEKEFSKVLEWNSNT